MMHDVFDWDNLHRRFALQALWRDEQSKCIRLQSGNSAFGVLVLMDRDNRQRVVFEVDPGLGFRCRGGVELPVAGLRIWQVLDDDGTKHDLRSATVHVPPRG